MSLSSVNATISVDEYFRGEQSSEIRYEYDNGYVVEMVDVSRSHNLITMSLASEIRQKLKDSPCCTYASDMKVRIKFKESDLFYYPDVMVSCDRYPSSEFYEEKLTLIIEVFSPSTETRDKLEKLDAYTRVSTLNEYLTVAQERVEVCRCDIEDDEIVVTRYRDGDIVEFSYIELSLPIGVIYEDVVNQICKRE